MKSIDFLVVIGLMNKLVLAFCIAVLLLAWIGFPDIIKCPYKASTGNPCFFCGTMTSLSCAVHGNFKEALRINPIGVFVFVFVLLALIYSIGISFLKQGCTQMNADKSKRNKK